jgi:hypothetical protein
MSTVTIEAPALAVTAATSSPLDQNSKGDHIPLEDVEAACESTRDSLRSLDSPNGPPPNAVHVKQKWNSPRINTWRLAFTFFALFDQGLNDASFGVSLTIPISDPS